MSIRNLIRVIIFLLLFSLVMICMDLSGQNNRPTANSDYTCVGESSVAVMNLIENDYDIDGDKLKVVSFYYKNKTYKITAGSYTTATLNDTGKLVIYSNGQLQFWPLPTFNGDVGLEGVNYVLSDFHTGGRDTAEIVVHYLDSVTVVDSGIYCLTVPNKNGGFKYYPLVKRKELGEYFYYIDMEGNLVPIMEAIWKRERRKKIKPGHYEKLIWGD